MTRRAEQYVACVGARWGWEVLDRLDGLPILGAGPETYGLGTGLAAALAYRRPRYVFFLNWSWVVPPYITDAFECVNFHCTALPYGRGGNPIENLIRRGHTETVITAHRMTAQLDAGPLYARSGAVSLEGDKSAITARFVEPVAELVRHIVRLQPRPRQQKGEVVRFKRLTPEEYDLFWKERTR